MSEQLLTYDDVAAYWKVSVSTVRNKKDLPRRKIGRLVRFAKHELDEYTKERPVEPMVLNRRGLYR